MWAAGSGHTDTVIALVKAKANIDHKDNVVSLAGWMVVCVKRLITLWVMCAGVKVEMSRACCCSVTHANTISPITTIQFGWDAMRYAQRRYHHDIVSALEQVAGEGVV